MDQNSLKDHLAREADMIDPGSSPTEAVQSTVRARRRRNLTAIVGTAAACAIATGVVVSATHETDSNPVAAQNPTRNPSPKNEQAMDSGAPGPVVATMRTDAALKQYYPTIADLLASPVANAIVLGKISNVAYGSSEGLATTALTVDVTQKLFGTTAKTITVHEDGGYLPATEMIAEIKEKDPTAEPTIDPNGFVDVLFEGAPHAKVDDNVLLVLNKDPNPGREGDYMEVSSVFGRFTLTSAGTYQRPGDDDSDFQTTVGLANVLSLLKTLR